MVGGGIAGLAAAHRLVELNKENSLGLEVMLLEASSRLGGTIATERVDDFIVEAGPDSFITEKPWALRLCERLGLAPRLVSTQAAYQKIYVVHRGKLQALPEGFFLLAPTRFWPFVQTPLFSLSGKLRMAAEIFLPRGAIDGDESLGAFVRRRLGAEALDRIAQPLIGGIYACGSRPAQPQRHHAALQGNGTRPSKHYSLDGFGAKAARSQPRDRQRCSLELVRHPRRRHARIGRQHCKPITCRDVCA